MDELRCRSAQERGQHSNTTGTAHTDTARAEPWSEFGERDQLSPAGLCPATWICMEVDEGQRQQYLTCTKILLTMDKPPETILLRLQTIRSSIEVQWGALQAMSARVCAAVGRSSALLPPSSSSRCPLRRWLAAADHCSMQRVSAAPFAIAAEEKRHPSHFASRRIG